MKDLLTKLSFTEKQNFQVDWRKKLLELSCEKKCWSYMEEKLSELDYVLAEILDEASFFFCFAKEEDSNKLYLKIKNAKEDEQAGEFYNVKISHFEQLRKNNEKLETLIPYLSSNSMGALFVCDSKLVPSVFKLLTQKKRLISNEGIILSWNDEIPKLRIKIFPTDTVWKVWADLELGPINYFIDLWEVSAFFKSSFLVHQNNLYALGTGQFAASLIARYLLNQGAISLLESEVGDFIVELFNQIGPCHFEVASLLVEKVKLKPQEVLYLKTKGQGFSELSPIDGQLWFRYQNREMPAICHNSDRRWNIISSALSENKLYLYLPDLELEAKSEAILSNSNFCSYLLKREVFTFNFFQLHEALSFLLEASWDIWAENLKIKLLDAFFATIKTSSVGFFMEFSNSNKSLIDTWQLILILKKKSAFIKLDDGTLGILPQLWIKELYRLYEKADGEVFPHSSVLHFNSLIEDQKLSITGDSKFEELRSQLNGQKILELNPGEHFCGDLYDYQKQGLSWLVFLDEYHLGGLLADEMGLGKTVQVLAFLDYLKLKNDIWDGPTLIITPKSILEQWQEDARKFTPHLKVKILGAEDFLQGFFNDDFKNSKEDLLIVSYGVVRRYVGHLSHYCFERIILDEAQVIKNGRSKIHQAIRSLTCKKRLAITGTPIENSLSDFFSIFDFLNPGFLSSGLFSNEDQYPEETIKQAFNEVKPLILRRKKNQVLKNLPKKNEQTFSLALFPEQRDLYEEIKNYYSNQLNLVKDDEDFLSRKFFFIEGILRLRQVCCHPQLLISANETYRPLNSSKLDYCLQEIIKMMNGDDKAIFFSQFTSFLKIIKNHLDKMGILYAYLDGQTEERQAVVKNFQSDFKIKIFLISLKAGGLGLNITAANLCYILDPWWNPAVEEQAMDRIYRIGQTRDVGIYRLLAENTIEEKIKELQKIKSNKADFLNFSENNFLDKLNFKDFKDLFS